MMHSLRLDVSRHQIFGLATAAAGAGVIIGALLPWLAVFHGLRSYSGIDGLNGRLLAGGGAAAAVLGAWQWARPQARLRYAIGALGFGLTLFCCYLLAQLLDVYRGLQGVYLPALGPGLPLATASSIAMIATLFGGIDAQDGDRRTAELDPTTGVMLALSAGSGTIHLAVAAVHFIEFPVYGAFFVVLGVAQIAWAVLIVIRGLSRPFLVVAAGNVFVAGLYAVSRTTGVPLGPDPWTPEAASLAGIASTVFELILTGMAVWFLVRSQRSSRRTRNAGWVLPLIVGTVTVAAILIDVGAHSTAST